jgi:arabinofuranosyltransferase
MRVTIAAMAGVTVAFAVLVYMRRWMCDDGLIVVRVAREIHEGFGPNYNFFERAEPNTSALWLWIVTIFGLIAPSNIAYVAVLLGGALSVLGLLCAMDAARRLHRGRGETDTTIIPCSALIMLGVFPFWDYSTSGLETGLCFAWVSTSYWLLVTVTAERPRRHVVTAFVIGLGPLVRPDFALISLPMLFTLWWLVRPPRRRLLVLAAVAFTVPVAYTIYRAGYYGTLVPLPAIAKSAGSAEWSRGAAYLGRFVATYQIWLPLAALALLLGIGPARGAIATTRDRMLIATPIAAGLALLIYIVRVGGDFMHGRMLLVPIWLLVLPAMMLPLRRWTAPVFAVVGGWALITAIVARGPIEDPEAPKDWTRDWNERAEYVRFTRHPNPIDPALFVASDPSAYVWAEARKRGLPPMLIWDGRGVGWPLDPTLNGEVAIAAGRAGTAGATAPLDAFVIELFGLANPLGARITRTNPGRPGHEKFLPWEWVLAEFADPNALTGVDPEVRQAIEAARRALQCGEIAELLASVRDPMTPSRFWKNLTGAWRRTRLVIPSDPIAAERQFCGSAQSR